VSALVAALRKRGWVIRESTEAIPLLPDDVRARYPVVPPEVTRFLEQFDIAHNADENLRLNDLRAATKIVALTVADLLRAD